jgi:hypothetical protein
LLIELKAEGLKQKAKKQKRAEGKSFSSFLSEPEFVELKNL